MKVIVRCANNRVTKADMEREIERLFQENRDLRLSESHLKDDLAKSESESSQGMNAVIKFWEEAVKEKNKAKERAEEYCIAAMESDCRVNECEKRMDWLSKEVLEWKATAEGYKNQYEELKAQLSDAQKLAETVTAERDGLKQQVDELQKQLEGAVPGDDVSALKQKLEGAKASLATAETENASLKEQFSVLRVPLHTHAILPLYLHFSEYTMPLFLQKAD